MTNNINEVLTELSDEELLAEKLSDGQTPNFTSEFDPDEAERLGAFIEDALSEEDARDGGVDLESVG